LPIWDRRKWTVAKSSDEVMRTVTGLLAQKRATIVESSPSRVRATMGSGSKTRILGGIFVSDQTLPVKVTLSTNTLGGGTEIEAVIEDNLGFGSRLGMEKKYREYIQTLLGELEHALCGPPGSVPPPAL
jgi:hypothetical protein